MNRPFTPADSDKRFEIVTLRHRQLRFLGRLEFPINDRPQSIPDTSGILWLDTPAAVAGVKVAWLYVKPEEIEALQALKGLPVSVYRDANSGDCSNNGVSARHTRAILVGPVIDEKGGNVFEAGPGDALLVIEPWKGAYRAVPWLPDDTPRPWFMFGGNFVYTSDARFPRAGLKGWSLPIPVHDRFEG